MRPALRALPWFLTVMAFAAPAAAQPEPAPPSSDAPAEAPADPPAETPPSTEPPPAKKDPTVDDVIIVGDREPKTPTEHRMKRDEYRVVPGAFGDPFRAIDVLPGVIPIVSGLPYFYIRGAPPSAVGYYIDEVRVPYLFHFALGPGVIHPALVEEVTVHPAAYPARYGRYAGGIVAGSTRDPAPQLYGEAQVRIFDAGAYVEAPFADGRATVGAGGRYSYTAAILSLVQPDVTVNYRDYNARATYQLSDRWRGTVFTFGSFDYASNKERGVENVVFASEFHRVDMRLDHKGADGSVSRVAATLGLDRTRLEDARFAQNMMVNLRGRHRTPTSTNTDVEVGIDAMLEHYAGDLPSPYAVSRRTYEQAETLFGPRNDTATGIWASGTWRPADRWDLTATLRADLFTSYGKVAVGPSPRVTMRVPVAEKTLFVGALGIAPQTPAFAIPVPAVGYRGLPGGLAYAYQKSAGFEFALPWRFKLTTVGFHHSYFNLRDFAQDRGDVQLENPQPIQRSPTQAVGLEVFLQRKLSERYAAFVSATLNRSQLGSTPTTPSRVSPFDRTYVLQIGGVVDMGRGWRASSRFLTYGGWPADEPGAAQLTGDRLPPFYRIDVRLEKRWSFAEHRYISLVLEGLNVTANKEILSRSCFQGQCRNEEFGPLVIPSIGVEGAL